MVLWREEGNAVTYLPRPLPREWRPCSTGRSGDSTGCVRASQRRDPRSCRSGSRSGTCADGPEKSSPLRECRQVVTYLQEAAHSEDVAMEAARVQDDVVVPESTSPHGTELPVESETYKMWILSVSRLMTQMSIAVRRVSDAATAKFSPAIAAVELKRAN